MNINELISRINQIYIKVNNSCIYIEDLEDTYQMEDIDINTNHLSMKNNEGGTLIQEFKALYFKNCSFKNIGLKDKTGFDTISLVDISSDTLLFDKQKLEVLNIIGTFNRFELKNSNISALTIQSYGKIEQILIYKNEIKDIYIGSSQTDLLEIDGLKDTNNLYIGPIDSEIEVVFNMVLLQNFKNINNIKLAMIHIKEFRFELFEKIKMLELEQIKFKNATLNPRYRYEKLYVSCSNIVVNQNFSVSNIDFEKSVFKDINLSKCIFENSLIAGCKFHECEKDYFPDIPLIEFRRGLITIIFILLGIAIFLLIVFRNTPSVEMISYNFYVILVFTLVYYITFLFTITKHAFTNDENVKLKKDGFLVGFIFGIDKIEKKKLAEVESVYRQLKMAYESERNAHLVHEYLYSESLMKIRQKSIWQNLFNVDFYNYLVNGFGRRWRRALFNFFVVFFIAILSLTVVENTDYEVTSKAPVFLQEADAFLNNKEHDTSDSIVEKEVLSAILKMNTTYILTKLDILRVKTNGWFEETSFWSFMKGNLVGIVLLFLFGSFIIAFKRRLDK